MVQKELFLSKSYSCGVEDLYHLWTTQEGLESFFAPSCTIELKPYGLLEILFHPNEEKGRRGAEDERVLAFEKNSFFNFTWSNPPLFPEIREHRTLVHLEFKSLSETQSELLFSQTGWGQSENWLKAYDYFSKAWNEIVLNRLEKRILEGPFVWS